MVVGETHHFRNPKPRPLGVKTLQVGGKIIVFWEDAKNLGRLRKLRIWNHENLYGPDIPTVFFGLYIYIYYIYTSHTKSWKIGVNLWVFTILLPSLKHFRTWKWMVGSWKMINAPFRGELVLFSSRECTPQKINGWNLQITQFRKEKIKTTPPGNYVPCSSSGCSSVTLHMGVSKNNGIPKSSILVGFSIINHPFWGTPWKF